MNTNLLNAVNALKATEGADIFDNPGTLEQHLLETAGNEPRVQIKILIMACDRDFHKDVRNAAVTERAACKERLAQKLHNDEGLDLTLCKNTLDLIEAALFGAPAPVCAGCGAELKAHWKVCPECGAPVGGGGAAQTAAIDLPFFMPIDDVYTLELKRPYRKTKVSSFPEKECSKKTGVTLVSGTVERGIIKLYEEVEIIGTQPTRKTTITIIEMFNKLLDDARAGETIFARLDGISKYDVKRGQILIKPGSVSSYEG